MITVDPGFEAAVAAALGSASDAVVVRDPQTAAAAVRLLRDDDAGRAALLLAGPPAGTPPPVADALPADALAGGSTLPAGARWAVDLWILCRLRHRTPPACRCPPCWPASPSSRTWMPPAQLIAARPELTAVTRAGDVFTALTVTGGSATAPSLLEVQAAVDDAAAKLAAVTAELERNRFALVRRPGPARRSPGPGGRGPGRNSTTRTPGWRPSPNGWAT